LVFRHGRFAWYELMTTDLAAARAFYAAVAGWGARDVSTPDLAYALFIADTAPVGGLMELPENARKMGATPRWMGYVAVDDADAAAAQIRRLGGAVLVPPTDSNIGRIAVIADPQTATLALVEGLNTGAPLPIEPAGAGSVGWRELLAADAPRALAFYGELFGWSKADAEAEAGATEAYQLFAAGGQTIGGMFAKRPTEPVPFWLYYFDVADIDAAAERVKRGGGEVFEGPLELPDGSWIARCADPQGAVFALQGQRSPERSGQAAGPEVAWSSSWGGISSHGRLITGSRGKG
jgi:hypothetical protein